MKSTSNQVARGLLPYVATILSLSLAVTLRVEHSCSERPVPARTPMMQPSIYPVLIARGERGEGRGERREAGGERRGGIRAG